MSDFKLVTVSTHAPTAWYYTYREFFKSLRGEEPLILDGKFHYYSGLGSKVKMVYKAIKDGLVNTKYILFTDSWDVFFQFPPSELLIEYKVAFNAPVVFSSEKNCFPADTKDEYDKLPCTTSYKYLNSGMIVGETEAFLTVLEAMDVLNIPDDYRKPDGSMCHINDQQLYQEIFLKQPVKMQLDTRQTLCQTLHQCTIDEFDLTGKRIINKETNESPCMFHANGSAKDSGVKEPILKHLNLL